MTDPKGAPAPYAPLDGASFFELPCGRVAKMSDVVELDPVHGNVDQLLRYQEEVRLIQSALGVEPDGKIGPDTRRAAREVSTRFSREVVKATFVKLWMEAFDLGREARYAGLPEAVHAVCAYLHNKLCIAHADLEGEEHLDLDVATKRPVFIPIEAGMQPVERTSDLGVALLEIENARMRKCLDWIVRNKGAHVENVDKVAKEGLGQTTFSWTNLFEQ